MIRVSDVVVTRASESERETGLLAYISLVINDEFLVDGITFRRKWDGQTTISFPERRGRHGRKHPTIRPVDAEARASFELQVKDALREQGVFL